MDSDMKANVVTGLIGLCLLLGLVGQFGDSWLVEETEDGGVKTEKSTGLREMHIDMICVKGNTSAEAACDFSDMMYSAAANESDYIEYDDGVTSIELDGAYDECIKDMENAGKTHDDACEALDEVVSAGMWGGVILWMASLACLAVILLFILPKFEVDVSVLPKQVASQMTWAAGALTGVAVLVWYLLLPDGGDAEAGMSMFLVIAGGVVGLVAAGMETFVASDNS